MNYLLKSKPKNENRKKVIWIISLYIFLTLFGVLFGNFFRGVVWSVSRPVWQASSLVANPFGSITGYFSSKANLITKNSLLEEENAMLKMRDYDYDILLKENENLKEEFGRSASGNRVLGVILSRPPQSPYDTLILDAGSDRGVSLGSRVYAGGNILIGTVVSLSGQTSMVSLFSTGDQKHEAVLSRTGASFTLTGKGGQNFQLDVPKDSDIIWGDIFISPYISTSVVASVYYIDENSQSSFKTIYLKIPVNAFSLKNVYIEK